MQVNSNFMIIDQRKITKGNQNYVLLKGIIQHRTFHFMDYIILFIEQNILLKIEKKSDYLKS